MELGRHVFFSSCPAEVLPACGNLVLVEGGPPTVVHPVDQNLVFMAVDFGS
jgi:hypothetical protein